VSRLISLTSFVVAIAVLAAGCGGDDASATEQWAGDVCTSASTWRDSVERAAGSIGAGSGGQSIEQALDDVDHATQTFTDAIDALGAPGTEAGDEADAVITELSGDLEAQVAVIRDAVGGGKSVLETATATAAAVASMRESVSRSFDELRELDAGGELSDAFEDADECDDIRDER